MNRHMHRIIFNKARGQRMAVAEAGQSDHGGAPGTMSGVPPARRLTLALSALRMGVMAAVGSLVWVMPASAQVVVDRTAPTQQQPTLATSANGVSVVNIQTSSAGGVSRNTFQQFDVNAPGLILNNAAGATQSQLGGAVQGNSFLSGSGSARVILNEVNSPNASQLRGTIEVAGQRAQVVVANPAGITCDGCGFINANRATLTTGQAVFKEGVLTGYQVRDGVVRVERGGMNASQADFTDIIARAVQVNGELRANDLRVTAGRNEVDVDHQVVAPLQVNAGDISPSPTVAIDVAQLGGMYAGQIRLIGTEAGVGVRNAGTIGASVGDVAINTEGWLGNAGSIRAASAARIQSARGVENQGVLGAGADVDLTALNVTNTGAIDAGKALHVEAGGLLENSGWLRAQGNASLRAGSLLIDQSGGVSTGVSTHGTQTAEPGDLEVFASNEFQLHGNISVLGSAKFQANYLNLSDSHIAAQDIYLDGGVNSGKALISVAGRMVVDAGYWDNQYGVVQVGALDLRAIELRNQSGRITVLGPQETRIEGLESLRNERGTILASGGALVLDAALLDNGFGMINSYGDLSMRATSLLGLNGSIRSGKKLRIRAENSARLDNSVTSAQTIDLSAQWLYHSGGGDDSMGYGCRSY